MSSLVKAVRGGDIAAAQSALSALEADAAPKSSTYSPASSPTSAAPPAQSDLATLFQAVKGGDIAGAKTALGQLELDVRSAGGDHASLQGQIHGRGHGRGHKQEGTNFWTQVAAAFQSLTAPSSATTTPPETTPSSETTVPSETTNPSETTVTVDPVVEVPVADEPSLVVGEVTDPAQSTIG